MFIDVFYHAYAARQAREQSKGLQWKCTHKRGITPVTTTWVQQLTQRALDKSKELKAAVDVHKRCVTFTPVPATPFDAGPRSTAGGPG